MRVHLGVHSERIIPSPITSVRHADVILLVLYGEIMFASASKAIPYLGAGERLVSNECSSWELAQLRFSVESPQRAIFETTAPCAFSAPDNHFRSRMVVTHHPLSSLNPLHPPKVNNLLSTGRASNAQRVKITVKDPLDHEAPAILHTPPDFDTVRANGGYAGGAAVLISGAGGGVSGPSGKIFIQNPRSMGGRSIFANAVSAHEQEYIRPSPKNWPSC